MTTFNKSVVAIHAHPDDTEAFAAGTLSMLKERGYRVTIVTMTAGGMGGIGMTEAETIAQREQEAREAATYLGAEYFYLGGRDGYLYDTEELRLKTLQVIRQVEAGIVMTHLPMDYHADHRTTCAIVDAATMLATLPNAPVEADPLPVTPLFYHTSPLGATDPLGEPMIEPHFYVDVDSVIEVKMEMLGYHKSQIELMRVMHRMDDFFGEMRKACGFFGEAAGCSYAEPFWQHLGGGFQKDPLLQTELSDFIRKSRL